MQWLCNPKKNIILKHQDSDLIQQKNSRPKFTSEIAFLNPNHSTTFTLPQHRTNPTPPNKTHPTTHPTKYKNPPHPPHQSPKPQQNPTTYPTHPIIPKQTKTTHETNEQNRETLDERAWLPRIFAREQSAHKLTLCGLVTNGLPGSCVLLRRSVFRVALKRDAVRKRQRQLSSGFIRIFDRNYVPAS